MKKNNILLVVLLAFQCYTYGQCTESATDFGNNNLIPTYNVVGDVNITLNQGGQTVSLDLGSNFMTAAGPDIRAFLINGNGLSNEQLATTSINDLENIQFGLVGNLDSVNQNGAKSFTANVPDGTNIENFDKIFFFCLEFGQFWDFGDFTPFSQATCNVLSIDENTLEIKTAMYPNPAIDVLYISSSIKDTSEIRIFDTNGKMIVHTDEIIEPIDVSSLIAGLYIVEIISERGKNIKKLIIN